jgi:hypothetical protein
MIERRQCKGECGKVHTDGQCRSVKGGHLEDARHPTILRVVGRKLVCQSCYARIKK